MSLCRREVKVSRSEAPGIPLEGKRQASLRERRGQTGPELPTRSVLSPVRVAAVAEDTLTSGARAAGGRPASSTSLTPWNVFCICA